MNRTEYRSARRLIRDNGRFALRWLPADQADVMDRLDTEARSTDPLAERADILAYCAREGIACNVRHTAPRARFVSQTAMDDMRGESANDDREQMIDTIMECEGVDRHEAERLYGKEFAA